MLICISDRFKKDLLDKAIKGQKRKKKHVETTCYKEKVSEAAPEEEREEVMT